MCSRIAERIRKAGQIGNGGLRSEKHLQSKDAAVAFDFKMMRLCADNMRIFAGQQCDEIPVLIHDPQDLGTGGILSGDRAGM